MAQYLLNGRFVSMDIQELKRMAVNAMTGHLTIADPVYELGKALEFACDEVERLAPMEQGLSDANETVDEQADTISKIKRFIKELADKVEGL